MNPTRPSVDLQNKETPQPAAQVSATQPSPAVPKAPNTSLPPLPTRAPDPQNEILTSPDANLSQVDDTSGGSGGKKIGLIIASVLGVVIIAIFGVVGAVAYKKVNINNPSLQ